MFVTFLTVSISFERWLAVCRPLIHRNLKGTFLGSAWIHYISSVVLATLVNLPKWFETEVVEEEVFLGKEWDDRNNTDLWIKTKTYQATALRTNPTYILYGMTIPRWLFQSMGPLLLLITFSILTVNRLKAFNARSENRNEVRVTRLTFLLIVEYLVFNIPRKIIIILYPSLHEIN
ncbi:uncharacterized protein LOC111715719 [Eurytemora carolleeae]|uniref:uncharacterized protein LOC111715719 n=1 Tax=Eurytemora carolleeae TaxID=1294199 RepID=UPI000C763960|nr:uncharacterized protein LOC111715719 [Eurytemora carolleeae]|eukprot:XP_023346851.1 uncharacterized protein LOC111715719 [Eurytemora affinis]